MENILFINDIICSVTLGTIVLTITKFWNKLKQASIKNYKHCMLA